jgi:hypothetical protein
VLIFVTKKANSVELADNLKQRDFKGEYIFLSRAPLMIFVLQLD